MGLLTSMKYPFAPWAELAEGSSFLDEKPRSVKFERHMTAERKKAIDGAVRVDRRKGSVVKTSPTNSSRHCCTCKHVLQLRQCVMAIVEVQIPVCLHCRHFCSFCDSLLGFLGHIVHPLSLCQILL